MEQVKPSYNLKQLKRYNHIVYMQNILNCEPNTSRKVETLFNWCNDNNKMLWDYLPFNFEEYAKTHKPVM